MNEEKNADAKVKIGIYHAPWEKSFDKILTPFEEFIHRQTTSGLLLKLGVAGFIWLYTVSKPVETEG